MSIIFAHADEVVNDGFFNHMTGGDHWSGNGGFTVFWMVFFMLFVAVVVAFLFSYLSKSNRGSADDKSPQDILKSRYAKGEITKKQFEEMKKEVK